MDRREFLVWSGLAAGVLSAGPAFAFGDVGAGGVHPHEADVAGELAVAAALGKPLLVLVRPDVPDRGATAHSEQARDAYRELSKRGSAFGAWFRHGGRATWAHLALAHVTSASLAEVRAALPDFTVPGGGVPWLVWIETGALAPRTATSGVELPARPAAPERFPRSSSSRAAREAWAEEVVAADNARFDAWLGGLVGDRLEQRAAQALAVVDDRDALDAALADPGDADGARLHAAAAVALHRATEEPGSHGEALIDAVADASFTHLTTTAPRGTHWGTAGGCGSRVTCDLPNPDERRLFASCGMGHVPKISRHFLELFAEH